MKIERWADWGTLYYAPKDKGLTKNGTPSSKLGLKLRVGMQCVVTWPDDFRETLALEARAYRQQVHDMHHEYTARSTEYGFTVNHHGTYMWLPLEKAHDVRFQEKSDRLPKKRPNPEGCECDSLCDADHCPNDHGDGPYRNKVRKQTRSRR